MAWWGKRERWGGFGQKGLLLPPSLIQNREREGHQAAGGLEGGGAGGPAHGGGREAAQNGEEAEGVLFPCSP
jgi:hypothetical protein